MGSCFVAANGERIPNRGEVSLDMKSGSIPIKSTFQVSRISRPLWSVGKICDSGCTVTFDAKGASIRHTAGNKELGYFHRSAGGLYEGELDLMKPEGGFIRQG